MTWLQSQLFSHLPPWILPGSLKLWLPPSFPSSVSWALWVALVVRNLPARLVMAGDGKDCGFSPWVRKIPWRRKWQPTPVFLPGESHRQRSLVGCTSWGLQRVRHE